VKQKRVAAGLINAAVRRWRVGRLLPARSWSDLDADEEARPGRVWRVGLMTQSTWASSAGSEYKPTVAFTDKRHYVR
jgi:hypothetical protein